MKVTNEVFAEITTTNWNKYNIANKKIEYVDAHQLLVPQRLDIIAKYKYVEAYDNGNNIPFLKDLYKKHIEIFTAGSFKEPGSEKEKSSYKDYEESFIQLIENIKVNGMQPDISIIPVGKNNIPLNGGHRIAVAAFYSQKVPIIRFNEVEVDYGYDFFRRAYLDSEYLDYLVIEYLKLHMKVYFACLWPRAEYDKRKEAIEYLKQEMSVIAIKEVNLTYDGLKNLMSYVYMGQHWIGDIDNSFKGVYGKVDACYKENASITCVVFEGAELGEVVQVKSKIRNIFNIGNDSIHISDTQAETLLMARLLFNKNSIHALNYANITKEKKFINKILIFKELIEKQKVDVDDVLIDSSSVLGIYGLREPSDIDYLTFKKLDIEELNGVDEYDRELIYHSRAKEELIYHPSCYLYAYGMKFITLEELKRMKGVRQDAKDREDCKLIDTVGGQHGFFEASKIFWLRQKRVCRYGKQNIKKYVVYSSKRLGLYTIIRKLYHKIKGTEYSE